MAKGKGIGERRMVMELAQEFLGEWGSPYGEPEDGRLWWAWVCTLCADLQPTVRWTIARFGL